MMFGRRRIEWKRLLSLRSALVAAGVAGTAMLLVWAAGNDTLMAGFQGVLATITGRILRLLGHEVTVIGNSVSSSLFGISVVTACTGLFTMGLFAIAVLAYPSGWLSKLIGIGIGIGGVFLINVVRLVSLYYIGVHLPNFLDQAHLLVWQSVLIVVAVSLWLLWAGRIANASRTVR